MEHGEWRLIPAAVFMASTAKLRLTIAILFVALTLGIPLAVNFNGFIRDAQQNPMGMVILVVLSTLLALVAERALKDWLD